jgi:hypothetical protein
MAESGEASWYYDPILDDHKAAKAWHVTTEQWDALPPEHQGRMLETYLTERTQGNWEKFVSR